MRKKTRFTKAVSTATSADRIHDLLRSWRGSQHDALYIIARDARAWDDALVYAVVMSGSASLRAFLNNPYRPPSHTDFLARWLACRIQAEVDRDALDTAKFGLLKLAEEGHLPLAGDLCQELFVGLKSRRTVSPISLTQKYIASFLIQHPETTTATLDRILKLLGDKLDPDLAMQFVLHPTAATPELCRRVLLERVSPDDFVKVVGQVMETDHLRNDPQIRSHLLKTESVVHNVGDLRMLLLDANPSDCSLLFTMLSLELHEDAMGRILVKYGDRLAPHLALDQIEPFFTHRSREVRLAAIAAASRARQVAEGAITDPSLMGRLIVEAKSP